MRIYYHRFGFSLERRFYGQPFGPECWQVYADPSTACRWHCLNYECSYFYSVDTYFILYTFYFVGSFMELYADFHIFFAYHHPCLATQSDWVVYSPPLSAAYK